MSERFWYRVTRKMLRAGPIPMEVNDGLINLVKEYANEDEAQFINQLKPKQYYEYDDLKSITGLDDESLKKQLDSVLKKALLTEIPHKYKPDVKVFFITSLLPGLTEFIFMRDDTSQTVKNIASIQEEMFAKLLLTLKKITIICYLFSSQCLFLVELSPLRNLSKLKRR